MTVTDRQNSCQSLRSHRLCTRQTSICPSRGGGWLVPQLCPPGTGQSWGSIGAAASLWISWPCCPQAGYSGPVTRASMMWAAVLAAGPGAVLCYRTAAELHGLLDAPRGEAIHVMVPRFRTLRPMRRVVVHYSRRVDAARHPALEPPRTRLEETVLDLAEAERAADGAISWILSACGGRRTTPDRLLAAMDARPRIRRRKILLVALGDAWPAAAGPAGPGAAVSRAPPVRRACWPAPAEARRGRWSRGRAGGGRSNTPTWDA
jgi:hypothetical protein